MICKEKSYPFALFGSFGPWRFGRVWKRKFFHWVNSCWKKKKVDWVVVEMQLLVFFFKKTQFSHTEDTHNYETFATFGPTSISYHERNAKIDCWKTFVSYKIVIEHLRREVDAGGLGEIQVGIFGKIFPPCIFWVDPCVGFQMTGCEPNKKLLKEIHQV